MNTYEKQNHFNDLSGNYKQDTKCGKKGTVKRIEVIRPKILSAAGEGKRGGVTEEMIQSNISSSQRLGLHFELQRV